MNELKRANWERREISRGRNRWLGEILILLAALAIGVMATLAFLALLVAFSGCAATPKGPSRTGRSTPPKSKVTGPAPDLAQLIPPGPIFEAPLGQFIVSPPTTTNVTLSWAWAFPVKTNPAPQYFIFGSTNGGKSWSAITNSTGTNVTVPFFGSAQWIRVMASNVVQSVGATNPVSLACTVGTGLSYKVYWGGATGVYTNSSPLTAGTAAVQVVLGSGNYFLAATAIDTNGTQSAFSTEVRWPTNWIVSNIKKGGS
jgi:hypothetical protein